MDTSSWKGESKIDTGLGCSPCCSIPMARPLLLLLSENHFLRIGVKPSCSSSSHAPGGGVDELTACCCVSPDKHKGKNHQIEREPLALPEQNRLTDRCTTSSSHTKRNFVSQRLGLERLCTFFYLWRLRCTTIYRMLSCSSNISTTPDTISLSPESVPYN